jgi:hypothetical protein
MRKIKTWQRWGFVAAAFILLLEGVLDAFCEVWWYQETLWYQSLMIVNYPAGELSRVLLNWLQIPQIYDIPSEWHETVIIYLINYGLGAIWWFFLGAGAAVARSWFVRWTRPKI